MQYSGGTGILKDFAESTANGNPHPTDALGTNLRKGKGLSFHRGIAQFDGYKGNSAAAPLSRPAQLADNQVRLFVCNVFFWGSILSVVHMQHWRLLKPLALCIYHAHIRASCMAKSGKHARYLSSA